MYIDSAPENVMLIEPSMFESSNTLAPLRLCDSFTTIDHLPSVGSHVIQAPALNAISLRFSNAVAVVSTTPFILDLLIPTVAIVYSLTNIL